LCVGYVIYLMFDIADDDENNVSHDVFYSEKEATYHILIETDVKLQLLPNLILDRLYFAMPS